MRLYIKLVRSHAKHHIFDVSKNDTLLDELYFFWVKELLLVSIIGQLLILQLLLLFEKLGLFFDNNGGSLVVFPLSSAPIIFYFDGDPLIILSQLGFESFFCSLLYHLSLALFIPKVLGRRILNKGLMFVEE